MGESDGRCDRCKNRTWAVYPRTSQASSWSTIDYWLCKHCIDLEATNPDTWTGRSSISRGQRVPELRPRAQPAPANMHGKMEKCVWCGTYASPKYPWRGDLLTFCGWVHAGKWMDTQIESEEYKREEDEGIAYVKRSLGIE